LQQIKYKTNTPDSIVGLATSWMTGVRVLPEENIFPLPPRPRWLWSPPTRMTTHG